MSLGEVQRDNGEEFSAGECHQGLQIGPFRVHDPLIARAHPSLHPALGGSLKDVHAVMSICHAMNGRYANSAQFRSAIVSDKQQIDTYEHMGR